jgi:hypothetical membrane protein
MLTLAGPLAGAIGASAVIGFAALRTDGYSHATKAISELGAVGAPAATAFNLTAMIVPGFLIAAFGVALARLPGKRTGPILLIGSGLLLALAGMFPVDPSDMGAPTSIGHIIGAMGSGLLWAVALPWLGGLLVRQPGLRAWGQVTPWFMFFLIVNIGWQVAFQATGVVLPGWGQRIAFGGYFLWAAVTGILLWERGNRAEAQTR